MFLSSTAPRRRIALAFVAATSLFGTSLLAADPAASTSDPDATTFLDEITVSTTPGDETASGTYSVTVNTYTVSGAGTTPDATVNVPLIVN